METKPTIRAELRGIFCSDHDPIEEWVPEDPEFINIAFYALIGAYGSPGEDTFEFLVRTPQWYMWYWPNAGKNPQQLATYNPVNHPGIWGYATIIVPCWNYEFVWSAIASLCDRSTGNSWREVAMRLAHHGIWEYDPSYWVGPGNPY